LDVEVQQTITDAEKLHEQFTSMEGFVDELRSLNIRIAEAKDLMKMMQQKEAEEKARLALEKQNQDWAKQYQEDFKQQLEKMQQQQEETKDAQVANASEEDRLRKRDIPARAATWLARQASNIFTSKSG
jgi:hypothetical protein